MPPKNNVQGEQIRQIWENVNMRGIHVKGIWEFLHYPELYCKSKIIKIKTLNKKERIFSLKYYTYIREL